MMRYDAILIMDWSAANDRGPAPKKDAIWSSVWRAGGVEGPAYHRNRSVAEKYLEEFLLRTLDAGQTALLGFDFAFGYPRGFADQIVGGPDPLALWDWFAENLEDSPKSNNRFELSGTLNGRFPGTGPFWFNGTSREIDNLPHKGSERAGHGLPERRRVEELEKKAFSQWQMGGAGAVGSQTMTGMAALARLRRKFADRISVWPFEPLGRPVTFVEIWPSLIAPTVNKATGPEDIKDAVQTQLLAQALGTLNAEQLTRLHAVSDAAAKEEGWILGAGEGDLLNLAARPSSMPRGVAWTPVDVALDRLRLSALMCRVKTTRSRTPDAIGRVTAAPVVAARSNPPAANSAVDGYALDTTTIGPPPHAAKLIEGRSAAGAPYEARVPAGQILRILTGALIPAGVDAVVLEEEIEIANGNAVFDRAVKPGANIRQAGEDVPAGQTLFEAGHRLGAPDLALLSATGVTEIAVFERLRVGVLSTGSEIQDAAAGSDASRIFDANRPMLLSALGQWSFAPVDLGIVPDDRDMLRERLDHAGAHVDAILISGGASAGDEDHVSRLLREEGELETWRIAVKPGRPQAIAHWKGLPVFAMPGNPVAALICTLVFARPALGTMAGQDWPQPRRFRIAAAFSKEKRAGRREYLRARINSNGEVEAFSSEGSGRISGLSWADGLVELADGPRIIRPGDPVDYIPYSSFGLT